MAVWALLGLGLVLRLCYALRIAPDLFFSDGPEYMKGAARLLDGLPLPFRISAQMVRPPGYAVFIALCWAVTHTRSLAVIKIAQALVGTATCYYVYRLAQLVHRRTALWALAAAAVYPHFIYYSATICCEILFSLLFVAGVYHLCRATPTGEQPRPWQLLLCGVLFSLANLVRVNLSVHLVLLAVWLATRLRPWRRPVLGLLLFGLPVLLLPLPWSLAIYRQGMGLVWISDGAGVNTLIGHGDDALAFYCGPPGASDGVSVARAFRRPEFLAVRGLPPAEQSPALLRAAWRWDRRHLPDLPCLMLGKVVHLWRPWLNPRVFDRRLVLVSLPAAAVFLLGGLGAAWAFREGERRLTPVILLCVVASTVTAALVTAALRYRMPIIDPLFLACAGYPLGRLPSLVHARWSNDQLGAQARLWFTDPRDPAAPPRTAPSPGAKAQAGSPAAGT